jgi:sugar lactone lactonase YvrE
MQDQQIVKSTTKVKPSKTFRRIAGFVLGLSGLGITAFLLAPSPIESIAWKPAPSLPMTGVLEPNDELRKAELIGKGKIWRPEDITFDEQGRMYVPNRDQVGDIAGVADVNPRIDRITFGANGEHTIETYAKLPGGGPLDLRFDNDGNLIVASWRQGLISISPNRQVTVLVPDGKMIDGKPFGYADGIAIAKDGKIYFTQGTDELSNAGAMGVLSGKGYGRLLVYNPQDKSVRTLIPDLSFGNGVVLAPDESYVLVADQMRYQIKRYWLKGEKAGQEDIFANNLPGFVHNIYLDDKNVLWMAMAQPRAAIADAIAPYPFLKKQLAKLPVEALDARNADRDESKRGAGFVIAMDLEGNPLLSLHNPPMSMNTLSTAVYHDGYVYVGTIGGGPVIRYKLSKRP